MRIMGQQFRYLPVWSPRTLGASNVAESLSESNDVLLSESTDLIGSTGLVSFNIPTPLTAAASRALSFSDDFERFRTEAFRFPVLEPQQEYMLAKMWSEHADVGAAHSLVTSHLRLVVRVVRGFRGYGLPLADLASEGTIGLMRAVRSFNPDLGFRLSTYAIWWIKAAVQDFVMRSWSLVRTGTTASQRKLFFSLRKTQAQIRKLSSSTDKHPESGAMTSEEAHQVAERLSVGVEDVYAMDARLSRRDASLDAPMVAGDAEGDRSPWVDRMADSSPSHEELILDDDETNHRRSVLQRGLSSLSDRERAIIEARCMQEPAESLESLSIRFEVSRERIRQIESRALEKLREVAMSLDKPVHPVALPANRSVRSARPVEKRPLIAALPSLGRFSLSSL